MNAREMSREIQKHLEDLSSGTVVDGKLAANKRLLVKSSRQNEIVGGALLEAGTPEEHVEVADNLFLFFDKSTVVRWPKPIVGERKNYQVRVLPEGGHPGTGVALDESFIDGFQGKFYIDQEGQLFLTPDSGWKIDVVVFGNPGGETASNSNC